MLDHQLLHNVVEKINHIHYQVVVNKIQLENVQM